MNTSWITQSISQFLNTNSGLFVPLGMSLFNSFAIIMAVALGIRIMLTKGGNPALDIFTFLVKFFVVLTLLRYWNSPLPWVGLSAHQLIPEGARELSQMIDESTLAAAVKALKNFVSGPPPSWSLNPIEVLIWATTMGFVIVMQVVMFLLGTVALFALAIGAMLGPLAFWSYLTPRPTFFWNWVDYTVSWAMYQVVASAIISIWAGMVLSFLTSLNNGSLGVLQGIALLAPVCALAGLSIWAFLHCEKFTAALYGNAVSTMGGLVGSITRYA